MMPAPPMPDAFKVSKSIRDELPDAERAEAAQLLWNKSLGRCALCDRALPADGKAIDADHFLARAEASGGPTTLANLYLAHRECNRSRKNLSFDLAHRVIRFSKWCTDKPKRTFDEVIAEYVPQGKRRVEVTVKGDKVSVLFGSDLRTATLYTDPATETKYFFLNAPVAHIQNDLESQPRYIEHDHVRTLAIEFNVRPVHEPSNCRVVMLGGGLADLFQFDGQHKTTAQIILGRDEVPMKFYYQPSEPMIQQLVVQIQQGIKKRPLSTTDTLRKLDDVVRDKVEEYREAHNNRTPSERELVDFQPLQDRSAFKARLLGNFEYLIMTDPDFEMQRYASRKTDRLQPFTDTVLVKKLIRPLVCQDLLDEPIDQSSQRETERQAVVSMLNLIAEKVLDGRWHPTAGSEDDITTHRARVFFYQGAISWWLNEVLLDAFKYALPKARWRRMFLEDLAPEQTERLAGYIDILCGWDIWSTTDPGVLAAFRSNTVANVTKAVPHIDYTTLVSQFND